MGDVMSYRISYDNGAATKKFRLYSKTGNRVFLRLVVVLAVCVAGICVLSGQANKLVDYILPGDPDTTKSALTAMTDEIKAGRPLKETITTFCREIIYNASARK